MEMSLSESTRLKARPVPEAQLAPKVTAIVLNYLAETEEDTIDCIESLQASDYPRLDILLVDNAAPLEVSRRLAERFPEVTFLRSESNLGFAGGNNFGIELALRRGCDYLLLLNNDAVVEPDCVSHLVKAAESRPGVACVGGKILYHDEPNRIWFGGGWFSAMRGLGMHRDMGAIDHTPQGGTAEEVTFLTGCCMLLSAPAVAAVGGFQEDFFAYVEDAELSVRLQQAGYRLVYHPAARLYHRTPVDPGAGAPGNIMLRDRNRRRLMQRRFPWSRRLPFILFYYASRAVYAGRFLAQRDWPRLRAIWRGVTTP